MRWFPLNFRSVRWVAAHSLPSFQVQRMVKNSTDGKCEARRSEDPKEKILGFSWTFWGSRDLSHAVPSFLNMSPCRAVMAYGPISNEIPWFSWNLTSSNPYIHPWRGKTGRTGRMGRRGAGRGKQCFLFLVSQWHTQRSQSETIHSVTMSFGNFKQPPNHFIGVSDF